MDLKELKALLRIMEGNDVEELEVEEGGRRIRIRRRTFRDFGPPAAMTPVPAPVPLAGPVPSVHSTPSISPEVAGLLPIESPMVGTFYRAPAPGADPYVKEGDLVQKGSVLCIIEAMKLMNEIESEIGGRVAKILVENGQPVEYGQSLFLLEPV